MAASPPLDNTTASPADVFPPLLTSDVLACQFSSWYPLFKRVSPKATVIRPIPNEQDFIDWLESDGLFMPEGSGPMGVSELSDSEDEVEENQSGSSDEEEEASGRHFSFLHLDAEIRAVLQRYDGAVFPKLNWSSPQDAAWMIPGQNLKCQHPADVYLLLKSSDFISHDLDHAFDGCADYNPTESTTSTSPATAPGASAQLDGADIARLAISDSPEEAISTPRRRERPYPLELVLKKWFDMPKSQEWRCFVRGGVFLGISQRDTTYYDFLQSTEVQDDLRDQLVDFWEDEMRDKLSLTSYAFDVYLTRDNSKVFLIDLNPFSPSTDPLLFSYNDLHSLLLTSSSPSPTAPSSSAPLEEDLDLPVLRLVTSEVESARSLPRYSHNRYPKDVVEMSEGQSVAEFAKEWMGKVAEAAAPEGETEEAEKRGGEACGRSEERFGR